MKQGSNARTKDREARDALRVLHVVDNLKLGGTQTLLLNVVQRLEGHGIATDLCVLNAADRTFRHSWLPEHVTYLGVSCDYRKPWQLGACARRLRRVIDRIRPDIVHSYLWLSDVTTAIALRATGIVHVSHVVDRRDWLISPRLKHRARKWLTQWAFRQSRPRFIAVSDAARGFAMNALGLPPESVTVAHNGVEPAAFAQIAESEFFTCGAESVGRPITLGAVSRLEPEKGHEFLLQALVELQTRGHSSRLLITGDGAAGGRIRAAVRELGLDRTVDILGCVADVRDVYAAIDVLVVPSIHSEGLPTAILEAMASERVVIATDIGGAAEALRHSIDGLIVPARDPQALAHAIQWLIEHPRESAAMAHSARHRAAESLNLEIMVDRIVDVYRQSFRSNDPLTLLSPPSQSLVQPRQSV